MSNFKKEVINYLKHDRTLSKGKEIYNRLPGKSIALQNSFNRMNNSERDIKVLCYQLCKLVGITQQQYDVYMNMQVVPKNVKSMKVVDAQNLSTSPEDLQEKTAQELAIEVISKNVDSLSYSDLKKIAKHLQEKGNYPKPVDQKKDTLIAYLKGLQSQVLEKEQSVTTLKVKQAISLRDQFPFLREKDCPELLKVLVADLITAREKYVAGREKLWDAMTPEQESALASDIVENFIENKEAFAELEYYREHNQLLGKHPLFKQHNMRKELEALSVAQLTKKVSSLRKNISTNKAKAEKLNDGDDKLSELSDKVAQYEWQLEVVQELLNKK